MTTQQFILASDQTLPLLLAPPFTIRSYTVSNPTAATVILMDGGQNILQTVEPGQTAYNTLNSTLMLAEFDQESTGSATIVVSDQVGQLGNSYDPAASGLTVINARTWNGVLTAGATPFYIVFDSYNYLKGARYQLVQVEYALTNLGASSFVIDNHWEFLTGLSDVDAPGSQRTAASLTFDRGNYDNFSPPAGYQTVTPGATGVVPRVSGNFTGASGNPPSVYVGGALRLGGAVIAGTGSTWGMTVTFYIVRA